MIRARVEPSVLSGRIEAPPSKSYTHRALVAGFLAARRYEVRRPLTAADTLATRRGLRALGARVASQRARWTIEGPSRSRVGSTRLARVRCGESGTTLRLLTALAASQSTPVIFEGAPGLAARPMAGLVSALRTSNVEVREPSRGSLPLFVRGPIRPGELVVDGSVSSQYISALLLVLPTLDGPSRLRLIGTPVSTPYIAATIAVLRHHSIRLNGSFGDWRIPGRQRYAGSHFLIPGDASSAAYLWAGAALTGGSVEVRGVPAEWPQADRQILASLRQAGARVRESRTSVTVVGPMDSGFDVDLTECPDLYPLVGALASCLPTTSYLRGAAHVVFKESNRKRATIELARQLGASVTSRKGTVAIRGSRRPSRLGSVGSDDHRVVMSAAVASLVADGRSVVDDAAAVGKSFPGFWKALADLGGKTSVLR